MMGRFFNMKKIFAIAGLMMAAVIALTGCRKDNNFSERDFVVTASVDSDTRTTNDGLSTLWAKGDALSVFYAADGTSYTSAGKFTVSDGIGSSVAQFTAATAPQLSSGSYDWYALYPYRSEVTTPASSDDNGGYTYVGNRNGLTQQGYDNTGILCGNSCPMYGIARNVPGSEVPSFTMKQLASVIEFNIINKTDNPVRITKVTLDESESGEAIAGSYYIDFTGEAPSYVASGDQYVSSKAFTIIADPADLAVAETAKVYLPIKPYTHDQAKDFVVIVEGDVNGRAISTTVPLKPVDNQCVFSAGKIKRVTVNLTDFSVSDQVSVTEAVAAVDGTAVIVGDAIVAALTSRGYVITDGTSNVYVFQNANPSVELGDKIRVSASKTTYYGLPELTSPVATVLSSGNEIPRTALNDITGTIDSYNSSVADYLTVTGTLANESGTFTVTPDGGTTRKASASNPHSSFKLSSFVGKNVKMTGYFNTIHSSKNLVQIIVTDIEEIEGPGPGFDGTTVTMNMRKYFDDHKYETGKVYANIDLSEAVRMSTSGEPNCGAFFDNGNDWRLYQNKNGNVIITVADGCTLYSVKFTYGVTNGGVLVDGSGNQIESGSEVLAGGNSVEFTVGNSGDATNGQVKIKDVEVKYTGTGTLPPVEEPEPTPDLKLNGKNSESLSFEAVPAGPQEVAVTCDNTNWTVTGAPDWVSIQEDKGTSKIIVSVLENTGAMRSVDLSVNHSNGEIVRTLTVTQAADVSGQGGANTATLTNADIVAAGDAADSYRDLTIKDAAGNEYKAYAIKKAHSKATSSEHFLQIKKYANEVASYIQIPVLGTKIRTIKMTVSNASKPRTDGGNTATVFFSASNSTSAAGEGVVSGVGASSITIDASSLNLNTGYITAGGAVRIWDIEITYD